MSQEEPQVTKAQFAQKKGEIALRDHEYDGIQEYDQLLPNWWLFIFFAFTFFFFAYWIVYYQFGMTRTDVERLDDRLAVIREAKAKALEDLLANLDDEALVNSLATDPEQLMLGEQVYMTHCLACHGQDLHARMSIGDGQFVNLPGFSLKDGEWKYGGQPMDIFRIINEGTPADSDGHNGARMLAYGDMLPPTEIAAVTAYIIAQNPEEFGVPESTY
jgi:cytochrome c oxidase cbb3-type subunit 3